MKRLSLFLSFLCSLCILAGCTESTVSSNPKSTSNIPWRTISPTITVTPTATPKITPTPKPTATPKPTPVPKPTATPVPEQTIAPEPVEETVYITNTGEKYHRSGCRYLRKSKIAISLSNAKSRGYEPCKVCNP